MWIAGAGALVLMLLWFWVDLGLPDNEWLMLAAVAAIFALGGWLQFRGDPQDADDLQPGTERAAGALPKRVETVAFFASAVIPYWVGLAVWGLESDWPIAAALLGIATFVLGYLTWLSYAARRAEEGKKTERKSTS
ncbi:hypothetical protein GIW81_02120 [Hyphomicrobium sp. xq]|uniref:Uncharacterized protein n=1 Tax=Hyphomicrobium album TaxID=2665159 RepID=A0A6I3KG30_9HYPH|nr:hypothetical protein [Hyphomicrobium album]MTD93126.1 hypothetical protein [Hyphomicrobium album]